MISGIYAIYNIVNNKIYFGQSSDVTYRLKKHKQALIGGYHKNNHLQKAVNKYGITNFIFTLILECVESKRDYYEIKFIKDFKTANREYGYNIQHGGCKHKHLGEESIAKIKSTLKGRITNPTNHARLIATQKKDKHPHWIQEFTIEDAVNDYQAGLTIKEICEKHNVSTQAVWTRLKHSGIKFNRQHGLRKNYDVNGMVTDKKEGMSLRKLAIKYGHSRNTITKILTNEGVI